LIQDQKCESNPGKAESCPLGDGELVVSEIDGFIFEGYSSYKHQYGGDNGNEGLEVQHQLFILDYPILMIFGDRQTWPLIAVYSPNSDRQLN
jgi:hypothetical protein